MRFKALSFRGKTWKSRLVSVLLADVAAKGEVTPWLSGTISKDTEDSQLGSHAADLYLLCSGGIPNSRAWEDTVSSPWLFCVK